MFSVGVPMPRLLAVDLFCGCGGFLFGAWKVGIPIDVADDFQNLCPTSVLLVRAFDDEPTDKMAS